MQSNIYGYSWYLDIVCDRWGVFVLNDYEAVMPVPWRRKLFIKYAYHPFWLGALGIYSKVIEDENEFLIELFSQFKKVKTYSNKDNAFSMFEAYQQEIQTQVLDLNNGYSGLSSAYKSNRRKELFRANKSSLTVIWNDEPENLISLYKTSAAKRLKKKKEKDYEKLLKLMKLSISKKQGEVISVYDEKHNHLASGFFVEYKNQVTMLVSTFDYKNRKKEADTKLIDCAVQKYSNEFSLFDFGISTHPKITDFYKGFGVENEVFTQLKQNRLSWGLKLFVR